MKNIICLLTILSTAFITADCAMAVHFTIDPIDSIDPSQYLANGTQLNEEAPPECAYLLETDFRFAFEKRDLQSLTEYVDTTCPGYKKISFCLRAMRRYANQSFRLRLDLALGNWDFLCSDRAEKGLKEFNNSPCSNDNRTRQQLKEHLELCTNSTAKPNDEKGGSKCAYIKKVESCAYQTYTEICGESVAKFLHKLNMANYKAVPDIAYCFLKKRVVEVHEPVFV